MEHGHARTASPVAAFLMQGHEETYLRWFFRNMAYTPDAILPEDIAAYVRAYQQPGAVGAGLAYYRALYESGQQNRETAVEKLTIPVLAIGGSASAATQLLMVAQVDSPWVTANFKETQLRKMRPGQRVTVKVDALDRSFNGTVESIAASTGDRASVLPAENATGNYVKVVQRLPVRIRLNADQDGLDKVRPGMSVEPTVHFN